MTALTVYDAAAGSGKTYTLVRNYLLKILSNPNKNRFKQILAVTFTNKAVAEMKNRILESLHGFSQTNIPSEHKSMFAEISKELFISAESLQQKSKEILHFILHNYTAFSVQTIDKFTQSVIRTFAYDLGLSTNFEVELDQNKILELAVDELIDQVGIDPVITETIIDFAKSQINEDTGWNIKQSLLQTAKIIFNEDDIPHIQKLSEHTFSDFKQFNKKIISTIAINKQQIKKLSEDLLEIFEAESVISEFIRNSIPNHFKKLAKIQEDEFVKGWRDDIDNYSFYTKGNKNEIAKQKIDELKPQIIKTFNITKKLVFENEFLIRVQKNIVQMSLFKSVNEKLDAIKKEKQVLLISDFNKLIYNSIKNQPTPFIYERLGEKYKDFFIDEFQDTSVLQWQNLFPLADNAVSSLIENTNDTGSVTLVGDAKQAIYRWRGGKAEQFLELSTEKSPFANQEKTTVQLDTNYRSFSNIINFNNSFFTYLSEHFNNPAYAELYKNGNRQNTNHREGGFIQFEFIDAANAEEKSELYPEKVAETIRQIILNGFEYGDISILVRKNAEGVEIANYLNEQKIPVLSFEALLVKNSNEVQLLITLTEFLQTPSDNKKKLEFLKALVVILQIENVHEFLSYFCKLSFTEIAFNLSNYDLYVEFDCFEKYSLYEAYEALIRNFNLNTTANANLQFFLDFVFEFTIKNSLGVSAFIDHWNAQKEKLSVVIPEGKNAIQIMSIHKSKGLEFPVVIYPYADTYIYDHKKNPDSVWFPVNDFSEIFNEAYVKYNEKIFEKYSEDGNALVQNIKQLQELDNFNVLYVALTRAKEQLYVISNLKNIGKPKSGEFQYYFTNFLEGSQFKKEDGKFFYGIPEKLSEKKIINSTETLNTFISSTKESRGIRTIIPDQSISESRQASIDAGIFIHELLSNIYDRSDAQRILKQFKKLNLMDADQYSIIENNIYKILNHKDLLKIFRKENTIFNERDFVHNSEILRPDRIEILNDGTVYIIDYKTGEENIDHQKQLSKYQSIFTKTDLKNVKKVLIYLGDSIFINKV